MFSGYLDVPLLGVAQPLQLEQIYDSPRTSDPVRDIRDAVAK